MPFGKYQGHLIQVVVLEHEDYCKWLLENVSLDDSVSRTIQYYMQKKEEIMNKQIATQMIDEKAALYPKAKYEELIRLVAADAGLPVGVIEDVLSDED